MCSLQLLMLLIEGSYSYRMGVSKSRAQGPESLIFFPEEKALDRGNTYICSRVTYHLKVALQVSYKAWCMNLYSYVHKV